MPKPTIRTLGELRQSDYHSRSVRDEIRNNLMRKLANKEPLFEGIVGYDDTVIPQFINALLSRHNILLLGLRGQAKTRLLRQLTDLLDEYVPIVAGSDVNDDPLAPISRYALNLIAEQGEDTPIEWLHRNDRYREKLATPDVSIADLIGDLDPVKAAVERKALSDEGVISYGIIPRTNR
ncbi:MAG: magnesium chelatase, partial [Planctomycetes bacterium]|nr:magnesium chelatase [Planctomycetota bacterium]